MNETKGNITGVLEDFIQQLKNYYIRWLVGGILSPLTFLILHSCFYDSVSYMAPIGSLTAFIALGLWLFSQRKKYKEFKTKVNEIEMEWLTLNKIKNSPLRFLIDNSDFSTIEPLEEFSGSNDIMGIVIGNITDIQYLNIVNIFGKKANTFFAVLSKPYSPSWFFQETKECISISDKIKYLSNINTINATTKRRVLFYSREELVNEFSSKMTEEETNIFFDSHDKVELVFFDLSKIIEPKYNIIEKELRYSSNNDYAVIDNSILIKKTSSDLIIYFGESKLPISKMLVRGNYDILNDGCIKLEELKSSISKKRKENKERKDDL